MNDATWLADLLAHGLIRESFVPPPAIQELRDLTRIVQVEARVCLEPAAIARLIARFYLDTSFFDDMQRRFGACDTAKGVPSQAYVIAHEIGHHVQNLLGILPRLQEMQQGMDREDANRLQVMAELQADCFAGVWANHSQQKWKFLEPGDVEAALQTASAIGDDRLHRRSQGYCGARRLHARLIPAARALVWYRAQAGGDRKLRHVQCAATLRRSPAEAGSAYPGP